VAGPVKGNLRLFRLARTPNPFPLVLTHGYPDSFYRFAKIIPMLTDPESFGGRPEDAFDIVVPDLPGHGFSDKPAGEAWSDVSRR
jgi:pimeloyl-ACP methyl ester carboxylesterase